LSWAAIGRRLACAGWSWSLPDQGMRQRAGGLHRPGWMRGGDLRFRISPRRSPSERPTTRRLANSTRRDNGKRMIQTTTHPHPPCQRPRAGPRGHAARPSADVRRDGGPVSDHQQPACYSPSTASPALPARSRPPRPGAPEPAVGLQDSDAATSARSDIVAHHQRIRQIRRHVTENI